MSELIINIPTKEFWETLPEIENGHGLMEAHLHFLKSVNMQAAIIGESYSHSVYVKNCPIDYHEFWFASSVGINFRYTLLAFALTIPKDMIP